MGDSGASKTPALVLATRNRGKVEEFRALLRDLPIRLLGLHDFPDAPEVEEHEPTYAANAAVKALAVARACRLPALADDSGLEVDALGGRPGIHSARYSGRGPDANIDRLLEELRGVAEVQRSARFRCAIVVARPDGRLLSAEGKAEGHIAETRTGDGGFGYDPVFIDPATGRSFAELTGEEKNRISHRARACAALRSELLVFLRA